MDWENHKLIIFTSLSYRTHCTANEKHDEIIEDIEKAKTEFGSVFSAPKKEKRKESHGSHSKSGEQSKRTKTGHPKKKVEIEYNGSLLPICLETLDNSIVAFFNSLSSYVSSIPFIIDTPFLASSL